MKSGRLCFLKDTWRPNSKRIHPELDVYKHLRRKEVRNIATAIGGGDVEIPGSRSTGPPGTVEDPVLQCTVTQNYLSHLPNSPLERFHYRLVIQELGRPLDKYEYDADMIGVVFDALQGEH